MTKCMPRQHAQPTKDTTTHSITAHKHNSQPTHTTLQQSQRTTDDDREGRASLLWRQRPCQGRATMLPCCTCCCLTGGGSPRSEGGSTAGCQRGTESLRRPAALAQWACPLTREARAGAALAASEREGVDTACWSMMTPWAIERVERAERV